VAGLGSPSERARNRLSDFVGIKGGEHRRRDERAELGSPLSEDCLRQAELPQ
jgi:hypothetical protein